MVLVFFYILVIIWIGLFCIIGIVVGSFCVCICFMNIRVIGIVVYIWNILIIFFKIILCNYKDFKRFNFFRKIIILFMLYKGFCYFWLYVYWKEFFVFV